MKKIIILNILIILILTITNCMFSVDSLESWAETYDKYAEVKVINNTTEEQTLEFTYIGNAEYSKSFELNGNEESDYKKIPFGEYDFDCTTSCTVSDDSVLSGDGLYTSVRVEFDTQDKYTFYLEDSE